VSGLIDGNFGQFGAQLLGAATILIVNFTLAYGFFKIQNRFTAGGIRSSAADEIAGLDSEMGVSAYTEFELVRHNGS